MVAGFFVAYSILAYYKKMESEGKMADNAINTAIKAGADNRVAVWNFFQDNPCHTKAECAAALGLSAKTVGAHCKAIRDGWRPPTPDRLELVHKTCREAISDG